MARSFLRTICGDGFKGSAFALTTGIFSAITSAMSKALAYKLKPSFVTAVRCAIQIPICLVYIAATNGEFFPKEKQERKYFLLRITMVGLLLLFNNLGIHYLPLFVGFSFCTFVLFVTSCLLSRIVLKEKIGICNLIVFSILSIGIILICQPSIIFPQTSKLEATAKEQLIGYIMMFFAGLCYSISMLTIRRMPVTGSITITLYGFIAGLILSSLFLPFEPGNAYSDQVQDYGLIFAASVTHIIYKLFEVLSLKLITLVEVEVLVVIDLPASLVLDIILFDNIPNAYSAIGGAIIFLCVLSKSLYEMKQAESLRKINNEKNTDEETALIQESSDAFQE